MKTTTTTTANKIQKLTAAAIIGGAIFVPCMAAALTGAGLAYLVPGLPAAIFTAAALQEIETAIKSK